MTTQEPITIPPRLDKRPKFRGFPVPFTVIASPDGTPDFRVIDETKRLQTIKRGLCALCGDQLGKHIYFVGGPLSVKNNLFTDGPMHEDCARYATKTCPFLTGIKTIAASAESIYGRNPGMIIIEDENAQKDRPAEMFLIHAEGYRLAFSGDNIYFRADRMMETESF